ncbi:MAG: GNAT family N-acetyltransferase [Steroidobacteraceae bacterium]
MARTGASTAPGFLFEDRTLSISLRDARSSQEDRSWIAKVFRDYIDDLDPMSTGIFPVLGEVGHREPDQMARWFGDPNAFPLVIVQAQVPVGFAMVARAHGPGADYRMGEFFIARSHRGLGLGRGAVQLILDRFAGRWEITEYQRNPIAVKFWRQVVTSYTGGRFEERVVNGEVRQTFESGPRRR